MPLFQPATGLNLAKYTMTVSNGAVQLVNVGAVTKLTNLTAVDWDPSGFWDVEDQRFQPTVEGLYNVDGKATLENLQDGRRMVIFVYKNDALYAMLGRGTSGGAAAAGFDGSLPIHMNGTTDFLDLRVFHANDLPTNILGDPAVDTRYTTFSATYLGPSP